jgi:hypothetical protein
VAPFVPTPVEKKQRPDAVGEEARRIFGAKALSTKEYAEVKQRRDVKRNVGNENVEALRYELCNFYGLATLQPFFWGTVQDAIKPPFMEELSMLLKVLIPIKNLNGEGMVVTMNDKPMAEFVQEVLKALGLAHPFDLTPTRSFLSAGLKKALLETALFKGYRSRSQRGASMAERTPSEMFGGVRLKFKVGCTEWSPGELKGALNVMMGAIGLEFEPLIEVSRPRRGTNKLGAGQAHYQLRLDAEKVHKMAMLAKLQFRQVTNWWQFIKKLSPVAREYLDSVDASIFDPLLERPSGFPLLADLPEPGSPEPQVQVKEVCLITIPP